MTTNYILTTMSRLVSFLMLLSLMVMMVVVAHPLKGCPDGFVSYSRGGGKADICVMGVKTKGKREALGALMPHKTKRGEFIV